MPRYVIERSFAGRLALDVGDVVERNSDDGVTWLHSYVSEDGRRAFDVCDAPTPEAIRKTSARNRLPIGRITEVRVLAPYPYDLLTKERKLT